MIGIPRCTRTIYLTNWTHHILQGLLVDGADEGWTNVEGCPVAGAPKVALDVGVGGGAPQVPDGDGGPRERLHSAGVPHVSLADVRGLRSRPEGHAHAVVAANVA